VCLHVCPQTYLWNYTQTHTHLMALCSGLRGWAGTRKVKPILILLKQETESGSGISWAICTSAHRSRQITMPAPHHSVFYGPDALPVAQVSKHWNYPSDIHRMFCTCTLHVTYVCGSVLCWRCSMLCSFGFMDDVIFAHNPMLLDVAKAHLTRSFGLSCKWHVGIPVAGNRYTGLLRAVWT